MKIEELLPKELHQHTCFNHTGIDYQVLEDEVCWSQDAYLNACDLQYNLNCLQEAIRLFTIAYG